MKILIALFLCVVSVHAAGAILEWDRNVETNVVGYRVYHGQLPRQYLSTNTTTNTTFIITNLVNGTNYFAVTAFDTEGLESEFSEEVFLVWTNRPAKVTGVRFAPVLAVQSAPTVNGPWSLEVQMAQLDVTDRARFYRLAIAPPELAVTPVPAKMFLSAPPPKAGKLTTSPKRRVMPMPPLP